MRIGFYGSIAFNFLMACCYAKCSIPPKSKYGLGGYLLYLAFSVTDYMFRPLGQENRGSLTADLFLCQYYATTLWTLVVAYSYTELYSYELEDIDEKGKLTKGLKREGA